MQDLQRCSRRFNLWLVQLHTEISVPLLYLHQPWAQLWFWPHLCVCTTLRCLFPTQMRGRKSSSWLGHTYSLRPGRGTAATTGVCTKCLWRPAGSSKRLRCAHSGGSPSRCPRRQGLACGGGGSPAPCTPLKKGALFPRQTTLPLGVSWPWNPWLPSPLLYQCSQQQFPPQICCLNPTL